MKHFGRYVNRSLIKHFFVQEKAVFTHYAADTVFCVQLEFGNAGRPA